MFILVICCLLLSLGKDIINVVFVVLLFSFVINFVVVLIVLFVVSKLFINNILLLEMIVFVWSLSVFLLYFNW